jgi:hypothetical protein
MELEVRSNYVLRPFLCCLPRSVEKLIQEIKTGVRFGRQIWTVCYVIHSISVKYCNITNSSKIWQLKTTYLHCL